MVTAASRGVACSPSANIEHPPCPAEKDTHSGVSAALYELSRETGEIERKTSTPLYIHIHISVFP